MCVCVCVCARARMYVCVCEGGGLFLSSFVPSLVLSLSFLRYLLLLTNKYLIKLVQKSQIE